MRWRGGRRLRVSGAHGGLLHRLQATVFKVGHAGNGQIEIIGPRPLHTGRVTMRRRQRRKEGRHDSMGRGTGAKVRRSRMSHVPGRRVPGQVRWVREDGMGVVSGGVMLRQAVVGLMGRRLVERGRPGMLKRGPMVVGIIWVRSLGLLARMRLLRRVVDIVIWSYTVVARQRASDTWVPPERTALAGRRTLNGNNLSESSPGGLGLPEAAAILNPRLGGPATLPLYPSVNWELRVAVLDTRLWPVEGKAHVVLRRPNLVG
jgi:hypothetical protein